MLFVFATALSLRFVFNFTLEHRLCHFGDAFYFLTSGSQLLMALKQGLVGQIASAHAPATLGVQAMTSLSFVDRLLIDGPVFPAYLAFVQALIGVDASGPRFDLYSLPLSLANSVMDALACVFIYQTARLAFNRRAGLIAGALAAFYPAAIVNTASCYSEPFGYFLIAAWVPLWLACQLKQKDAVRNSGVFLTKLQSSILPMATGIATALVMLSKPIFVALPPIYAVLSLLLGRRPGEVGYRARRLNPRPILLGAIGLLLTFAPWLVFTGMATGKASLLVNRYPTFNFVMGSRLESDGWRQYPLPFVPAEMKDALKMVADDFSREPLAYAAMEIRKVTRLWAGSWNNFENSFVLSPTWQDCYHQMLLFSGCLGLFLALKRNSIFSRSGRAAVLLAIVPLFHCIYIAFEPQSRYAFSAMPCIIALAAYPFALLAARVASNRYALEAALLAGFGFIVVHRFFPDTIELVYPAITSNTALLVDAAIWVAIWSFACRAAFRTISDETGAITSVQKHLTTALLLPVWLSISLVLISSSYFEQERFETKIQVPAGDGLKRTVKLSAQPPAGMYLLVDAASNTLAPPLVAQVNGTALDAPLPWWQVQKGNEELIAALSTQAQAMGTNIYRFRQWWVYFVPAELVRAGNNEIALKLADNRADAIVYADFPAAYSVDRAWLPSLDKASWTKAFTTIFRRDPRIYSSMPISNELAIEAQKSQDPFPRAFLIPCAPMPESAIATTSSLNTEPVKVDGSYPPSFFITRSPLTLPPTVKHGGYYRLSAEARSDKPTHAFASLNFSATQENKPHEWTSPWQPTHIPVTADWTPWTFGDRLPPEILNAENASISVTASPFPADLLFLNKKQALKRAIELKNVRVEFIPAGLYPPPADKVILH